MNPIFTGSATALITPFSNGELDIASMRALVEQQITNGTSALVALGTTGEPTTLTKEEKRIVLDVVVEAANGRVPVICGTGSNNTQTVIETEKEYRDAGCVAQLVVTPYYNRSTQEGLYAHYMHIAENTELPIILYNVPSRTNLEIMPETLYRLSQSTRFVAFKESSYNMPLILERVGAMADRMTLYSGNDDMITPLLALGAQGVISVMSNVIPKLVSQMTKAYFEGDNVTAQAMQIECLPFIRALFKEVSPIPCKYVASLLELCQNELRLPLVKASADVQQDLEKALRNLGVTWGESK